MIDVGIAFCFGFVVGGLIGITVICLYVTSKKGEIKSDELFNDDKNDDY